MKLSITFAALVAVGVGGGVARAERWNSRGWVKLGERGPGLGEVTCA